MSSLLGDNLWLFHTGALGDHVMLWPLVRALARQGSRVTVVASAGHARLCEKEVGESIGSGAGRVAGLDVEQAHFTRLWRGPSDLRSEDIVSGVSTVITCLAPPDDPGGEQWHAAATAMFPGARVIFLDRPDRDSGARTRASLWHEARVGSDGGVDPAVNPTGPIVLYPGAGSALKRLSSEQWGSIARLFLGETSIGTPGIDIVLGRNEVEQGTRADDILIASGYHSRVRVVTCPDLPSLSDHLRTARLFIGPDTGPTHLAAQLGIPTLAIFGPTDPRIWAPVGPKVHVLVADSSEAVALVEPDMVVRQAVAAAGG